MESRNGASSSESLEKLRVGEDALYSVNEPLLTRTFPGNCFDVILWDGHDRVRWLVKCVTGTNLLLMAHLILLSPAGDGGPP